MIQDAPYQWESMDYGYEQKVLTIWRWPGDEVDVWQEFKNNCSDIECSKYSAGVN